VSEPVTFIVHPLTDHQVESLRGLFHREICYQTKIVNKIGTVSDGTLLVEYLDEDQYKTISIPKNKP